MSAARDIQGPWLSRESLEALPEVKRDFDLNRDPFIARQIRDLETKESRRHEEQDGGRATAPKTRHRNTPTPSLTVPPPANANRRPAGWLTAKRDAAMAQTLPQQPAPQTHRALARSHEPER